MGALLRGECAIYKLFACTLSISGQACLRQMQQGPVVLPHYVVRPWLSLLGLAKVAGTAAVGRHVLFL